MFFRKIKTVPTYSKTFKKNSSIKFATPHAVRCGKFKTPIPAVRCSKFTISARCGKFTSLLKLLEVKFFPEKTTKFWLLLQLVTEVLKIIPDQTSNKCRYNFVLIPAVAFIYRNQNVNFIKEPTGDYVIQADGDAWNTVAWRKIVTTYSKS